jgi:subtilisin family serine protease
MRRASISVAVVLGGVLLASSQPAGQRASRLERQTVNGREVVAREVLVRFRNALQPLELAEMATETDAQAMERVGRAGAVRLRSRSLSAAALLARLARRPDVLYAEPNFIIQISQQPDDPGFDQLWGLHNIGQLINGVPGRAGADIQASPAWDLSFGSTTNVVAVIDTGIDYTHPDLAANMWSAPTGFTVDIAGSPVTCAAGTHGFNAITRTCNPLDDHYHGTHVSGTIGAVGNNGIGVVGVNWTARLMGIKFLDAQGSGSTADAIAAVEFAIAVKQAFAATGEANVRVLSNSWGGDEFSQALLDEINAANDADMLVVAGAGNNGFDNDILPFYPASFDAPNVISVAATDSTDGLAWFSNYGASSVHLAAPGVDILSTTPGNGYEFLSGTSMATPHVSGAAALVLSRCDLDTAALKETLLGTVDPIASAAGITVTGGRLNVNSALHACTAPPEIPAGLTARGADTKVTLSWRVALGAMRYNVRRSLTPGGPYALLAADVKGTGYSDKAVVNGTAYYYVVSAENTLGESADSNEASAMPNIPPDMVVSSFTAPAVAAAGSTIVVSVTTKNQGAGRAQPSTTRIYWSDNSLLDAPDVLLNGEQAVPELAAGALSAASLTLAIPTETTVGRHYLIVSADDGDLLDESMETNNRLARQLQIGPDLLVSSFTAPASGAAGGTISAVDTVKNQGGGDAASSRTLFYLSANSTLGAGDLQLAESRAVPAIAAGASSVGTTVLTIPPATEVGSYYIVAKADGDDVVGETSETNNTMARTILIGGDLTVSALTVPGNGAADSTIVVTDTTKNQGGAAAAVSVTRFYLSVNPTLDSGDTLLAGGRDVSPLASGTSSSGSTTVVIPAAVAPGAYYIVAKADADGAVPETSETNNTYSRAIQIGSDLVVTAFTVPAKAGAGTPFTVSCTIANQGGGPAAASITRFYLSANVLLDGGDVLLTGEDLVPDLAAGAADTGSVTLLIPAATAPGTYYIFAKADADNVVIETKETNNTLSRTFQIGAELAVSAFTVPSKGGAGSSLIVSDTTVNSGGQSAAPTFTKFYLSANTGLDVNDALVGSRAVPDLAAGATSAGTTIVTIPPNTVAGSYYLVAKADADAAVAETQETNNTFARAILIGSDLLVSAIGAPAKGAGGQSIVVTETIANQGGGAAGASVTRFYLSANASLDAGDVLLEGSRVVADLAAGASSAGSTSVGIPQGLAAGTFYVIAKADADNAVGETLETNNTRAQSMAIGPDLIVSSAAVSPASLPAGAVVNVTETVMNQGAGAVGPTTTRFYLSKNGALDAADVVLASGRSVPDLAAGASSAGMTPLTIPPGTVPGTYYVLARADGDGVEGETVETNNVTARLLQVTVAP